MGKLPNGPHRMIAETTHTREGPASDTTLVADIARLLHAPRIWVLRAQHRAALAALNERQMRDCGIDPNDVRREIAKPFWRG